MNAKLDEVGADLVADVYRPGDGSDGRAVVISSRDSEMLMTNSEADDVRSRATGAGLSGDIFIWSAD